MTEYFKPERTILRGVVGSRAYGLNHADSDFDRFGVYVADIKDVLGLNGAKAVDNSDVQHEPDMTHHELGKYLKLALKCNPTVSEILWLPRYEILHPEWGQDLIDLRTAFLSTDAVRSVYRGFCYAQIMRIGRGEGSERSDAEPKVNKLGRHAMRLLYQGKKLLETGYLQVDVSAQRKELFAWGEYAFRDRKAFQEDALKEVEALATCSSVLPDSPNRDKVNDFLVYTRDLTGFGDAL